MFSTICKCTYLDVEISDTWTLLRLLTLTNYMLNLCIPIVNIYKQSNVQVSAISTSKYIFFFRSYNFNSLNVLTFSTYKFQCLRSWMQLVQFFIFIFLCHCLCHLPICSLVSLLVFLTSVSTFILFLQFFLLAFDVKGQINLIHLSIYICILY
jgi:hypothetical protein